MLLLSKITILHIFDRFGDQTTKKKKFVTQDVTNFSPIIFHCKEFYFGQLDLPGNQAGITNSKAVVSCRPIIVFGYSDLVAGY